MVMKVLGLKLEFCLLAVSFVGCSMETLVAGDKATMLLHL
jgi:hypothetical protein